MIVLIFTSGPWDKGFSTEKDNKPNFEKLFAYLFPKKFKKNHLLTLLVVLLGIWLSLGFYIIQPSEQGVVLRFGRYKGFTMPGLHYRLPYPIDEVIKVNVTSVKSEEMGVDFQENLMLTSDENLVNLSFVIQWKVKNPRDYLFNIRDYREGMTVRMVAESAMREAVGKNAIDYMIEGHGRAEIAFITRMIAQDLLDEYGSGIQVLSVQMKKVDPPENVIASYRDVQSARADKERKKNEAYAYRNQILPAARGDAEAMKRAAEAYKAEVINKASGETSRFLSIYNKYEAAEEMTKEIMYINAMKNVLTNINKVLIDSDSNKSVNLIPLDKFLGGE